MDENQDISGILDITKCFYDAMEKARESIQFIKKVIRRFRRCAIRAWIKSAATDHSICRGVATEDVWTYA